MFVNVARVTPFTRRQRARLALWYRAIGRQMFAADPDAPEQVGSETTLRPYARRLHQALAVFRFFFFAMGVGLSFIPEASRPPAITLGAIVGLVGLYNVGRVWWPPDPSRRSVYVESAFLTVDIGLAVTVVLLTGGLDSPFLIYSLAPALTAGLFTGPASAALAAAASAVTITGAHEANRLGIGDFPNLLHSNYLAFALLYTAVCVLVAGLPFLANLNWQRRLRALAADSERQRLRREVHDDVAQTLAFLSLKLQMAEGSAGGKAGLTGEDVRGIRDVVRRSYVAVRDYLDGTADAASVEPIRTGVAQVVDQWSRATGLRAVFESTGTEAPFLTPAVKRQILQIAREALANAGKHANPSLVTVSVQGSPSELVLRIRDDGRGFQPGASGGHGLEIMRQRASIIDARLEIESAPAEGTQVVLTCKPQE
ncbi:MAG TPA: histidine kinase [Planctomycetaceae bacterium]|nr:histidine kinase [Planctomycetaceae bacterium]